jgi:hypothetical protein
MSIFNKNKNGRCCPENSTSTVINNKKFIEMGEITKLIPTCQTVGVKNHVICSLLEI